MFLTFSEHSEQPGRRRWPRHGRRLLAWLLLAWLAAALVVHCRNWWVGRIGLGDYPPLPISWPARQPARRAELLPFVVANHSSDACVEALGVPKVALMFLTLGTLPHEPTWRAWLAAAEGLLPTTVALRAGVCRAEGGAGAPLPPACLPLEQHGRRLGGVLYIVYAHVPPGLPGFSPDSLFGASNAAIQERVPTRWGTHTLWEATRALLRAAAADPANQRFVLLSESDIPLYDPATTYQQLLSEGRSRVNACPAQGGPREAWRKASLWRWTPDMQLDRRFWRKSSQWMTLTRSHAEAVLADVDVFRDFEEHCWSGWVPEWYRQRDCFSDEHYLPSLLATLGLEGECACEAWGGHAYQDWKGQRSHPCTFKPKDVGPGLIRMARGEGCSAAEAQADVAAMFVRREDVLGGDKDALCRRLAAGPAPAYAHPLRPDCPLTARKFHPNAAGAVHVLFTGCEGAALGLLRRERERRPEPGGGAACGGHDDNTECPARSEIKTDYMLT